MSNSVVKVTDSLMNDSLLLLISEDGTVTPDKQTVETYLNSKSGATEIQLMHINKSQDETIDVSIDNLTYIPDADGKSVMETNIPKPEERKLNMDEVARHLYNIRLDHDYTPHSSPTEEVDAIAKTLSILDGGEQHPLPPQLTSPQLRSSHSSQPETTPHPQPVAQQQQSAKVPTSIATSTPPKPPIKTQIQQKIEPPKPVPTKVNQTETSQKALPQNKLKKPVVVAQKAKSSNKSTEQQSNDEEHDVEESEEELSDDHENESDSDFDLESESKPKTRRVSTRRKSKLGNKQTKQSPTKTTPVKPPPKEKEPEQPTTPQQQQPSPTLPKSDKVAPTESDKEKKTPPAKKEKKVPKAIPDDFALFSTPDIIRRVGGKEPVTPTTPQPPTNESIEKPAKIEGRSKSVQEVSAAPLKTSHRISLDDKIKDKKKKELLPVTRSPVIPKRPSIENQVSTTTLPKKPENTTASSTDSHPVESDSLEMPSAEDISEIINADNNELAAGTDQIDSGTLDLDPSLLDNINNDMITEDILYQVAQSLAQNTELSNVIDKSLTEGNLVLDPTMLPQQQLQTPEQEEEQASIKSATQQQQQQTDQQDNSSQKGTQIVRPDGRIVVIPPIERPTTRSRNKRKEVEKPPLPKFTHKPLDEEHVSGNELDSSGEEEESEDDPNKLWCICNQPHNNRFMICCDTCEEWYHGKCVNITKAMGQQMESEGKEWICLFCKDPKLKRPQAAARRIRKASRNSRQSTDSAGSTKVPEGGSVPCVVCQKASRSNSIFCSETCILAHAQGVERVVVFERATGNMLTGNKAPSAANLEEWLKEHPGYEVVRSAGKVVTAKPTQHQLTQSKLKMIKNADNTNTLTLHKNKNVPHSAIKSIPKNNQNQQSVVGNVTTTTATATTPTTKPISQKNSQNVKILNKQVALNFSTPPNQQKKATTTPTQSGTAAAATTKAQVTSTPVKQKVAQPVTKSPTTPTTKDKPIPVKTPKARQAESSSTPHQKQENIRENVQKTLFEQLTNRLKMVDDLKLIENDVKSISTEIESQLYKCFGDTGQKYRNKYRSLIFNIKDIKNQTLWRRICEKSINPYQLVRLSPDDLASQELALWREREAKHQLDMIKKSELELLNCNRQYVLKTHKGEQVLEDNRPTDHIDTAEVITSLTESAEKDSTKRDSKDSGDKKGAKHGDKHRERKSSKDKDHHRSRSRHRSSSKDQERSRSSKRRSKSRERKHSDRKRSRSRGRDKHRRSSHKSSRHKKDEHRGSSTDKLDKKSKEILEQLVDNKIVPPLEDRLWKHVPQEDIMSAPTAESDSDHEPSSTVTIPTPPRQSDVEEGQMSQSSTEGKDKTEKNKEQEKSETFTPGRSPSPPSKKSEEIWRGIINMIDVAQISITAHEVSGDCNGLALELPPNLDIVGRISPETVWDYIGKMKCSNSKTISLVRLNAINVEEKMPYLALYSYLSSRNRLGVVKSTNKAVKDFYILPLASQKPIPPALLPINGPGFEESRPALLLGIIVRDKRKRPIGGETHPIVSTKKAKTEVPSSTPPQRSYTPPPVKDPRIKLPLPPPVTGQEDDDEPYSPEDSDPDTMNTPVVIPPTSEPTAVPFTPFVNKFDNIPGLGTPVLPSNTKELEREMEKLNKEIEMQKSEINSISQNIATAAASTEIGTSALANIALPSNLQQILDSIKTISAHTDSEPPVVNPVKEKSPDLTIPLILPTNFSRPLQNSVSVTSTGTIPLNLPIKKKNNVSGGGNDNTSSVLGSLSEEELIRKAAEMLGESSESSSVGTSSQTTQDTTTTTTTDNDNNSATKSQTISFTFNQMSKRPKLEHTQLPGLNDD